MTGIRTQARSKVRLNVIRLLAFGMLLIFPATSEAQENPPIAEQIAKTYGLDSSHRGTVDGKPFSISISDLSAKLTGSENWINAQ